VTAKCVSEIAVTRLTSATQPNGIGIDMIQLSHCKMLPARHIPNVRGSRDGNPVLTFEFTEELMTYLRPFILRKATKILRRIERKVQHLQGRGPGAVSVETEFKNVAQFFQQKEPTLCIDVGGNKGSYTEEIIRKFPKASIVIFEPSQHNIEILQNKFGKKENIQIAPYALSNQAGNSQLWYDEVGSGIASLKKRRLDHYSINFDQSEPVQVIAFENYWANELARSTIDFVKLDIEGAELEALKGFGEAIKSVRVFQFEFGGTNIDSRTYFQDFFYLFAEHDFKLFRISPLGPVPISEYSEREEVFLTTNYIAVSKTNGSLST